MISWTVFGLIAAALYGAITVFANYITESDYAFVIAALFVLLFCFLPIKGKEKWRQERIFKINPEIFFIVSIFFLSFENDVWSLYYDIFWERGVTSVIRHSLGGFFAGIILWYIATVFDRIVWEDKKQFLEKSWCLLFFRYLKRRKEAKILKKRRSEFKEFLDVIHEMAEGNIDVVIPENLGTYEDFRPDLIRIRDGIKDAVSREVKSERMKMELVSNVSHDLKTPLTAMITYIDLLKDESLPKEKQTEYLNIIETRADRLKHLIEDLFEVTKATTGNVKFEPVAMDMLNLIRQVTFEFEDKLNASNIEVVTEMPEGKIMVMADSQKTYRVFANLIGNAAKYAMKNSRLYIQAAETENDICIIIKNISATKITVSPQELTERFVRGDSARNTEGSGLGLAIAKSFTELQGGTLDVLTDGDLFKVVTTWKKIKTVE